MAIIPFGEYLPDLPPLLNPGATTIKNVVPLTKQSYGPIAAPSPLFSGSLTARCQGAYAFLDKTQAVHIFAGDTQRLYQMTAGSNPTWSDISKSAGGPYGVGSPTDPPIPLAPSWSMTSFGERIIATDYNDNVQTFLVGTDTAFSDLAAAAPKARFAATVRDFLMLANTQDGVNGAQPRRVWWSAIANPLSWPTPGTNAAIQVQSDFQDLEQSDLGQITAIIGGHLSAADGAIWCERGIWRVAYTGSSTGIFQFQVAQSAAGTRSPLSIALHRLPTPYGERAVAYYLGDDDFYAFDGLNSVNIGAQKIIKTFFADLDPNYLSMVQGGTLVNTPLTYWLYNSKTSGGLYDRMLIYNPMIQRWSLVDYSATPIEWGTRSLSIGVTLDALNNFFATLDLVTPGLDSGKWTGGSPSSAFFAGRQLNTLTGNNLAPVVETSEFQPTEGRRSVIVSARPLCDGGNPSIAIAVRDRLVDTSTYGAAVAINTIGECPQRVTGRYVKAQLTLPIGSTYTHLQGVDIDAKPEGYR